VYPKDDFDYKFVDQEIAKYYDEERHISSLLMWATGLAVFISCLGLLGLVLYTTTQRTKEIGVRKVLGASVSQIVTMISKEFLLLIIIAFLIAAPPSMDRHAQVASEFCIPYRYKLVDIRAGRHSYDNYCLDHFGFSNNKSSNG